MRRCLCLAMVCVLMLTGCTSNIENSDVKNPITLTLWHYYNGATKDKFDALVQSFNETVGKEKNILVEAYAYSGVNELADAVLASAKKEVGSPNMPNIFAAYSDNVYRLDKMEVIAPLDEYFTQDEINKYREEFISEGRFDKDGALKIVPVAKSTEIMYINATDFADFEKETGAKISDMETWEGTVEVAKMYYEWTDGKTPEPNDGKALFGVDSMANFMVIATKQLGEEIYTVEDGALSFNLSKDNAKKIWDAFYVPYINGYYGGIGRFRSDDTKSGDLLAYVGSTSSASYFPKKVETGKDTSYEIECETMPYPYFEGKSKVSVQQGAGMVVSKGTKDQEKAAVEFLKWFSAPAQNIDFAVATGYMPVQNEALNIEKILGKMGEKGEIDKKSPTVKTADVVYGTLDQYKMYASKPFEGSYDTRKVLDESLLSYAKSDIEKLNVELAQGKSKAEIVASLSSQENFENWYSMFCEKITALIK